MRPIRVVTVGLLMFVHSVGAVRLSRYGGRAAYFTVHPIYGGAQPAQSCVFRLFVFVQRKRNASKKRTPVIQVTRAVSRKNRSVPW